MVKKKKMVLTVAAVVCVLALAAGCASEQPAQRASNIAGLAQVSSEYYGEKVILPPTEEDYEDMISYVYNKYLKPVDRYDENGEDLLKQLERLPDTDKVVSFKRDERDFSSYLICFARVEERAVYMPIDDSGKEMKVYTVRITQLMDQAHDDPQRHYNVGDLFSVYSTTNSRKLVPGEEYYFNVQLNEESYRNISDAYYSRTDFPPVQLTRYGERVTDDLKQIYKINGTSDNFSNYVQMIIDRHIKHLY